MAGVYCHRDLVTLTMVHLVSLQRYRLASECPTRGPSVARTITNSVLQVLHPSLDDPLRDHITGQHQKTKPSKFSTRLLLQVTPRWLASCGAACSPQPACLCWSTGSRGGERGDPWRDFSLQAPRRNLSSPPGRRSNPLWAKASCQTSDGLDRTGMMAQSGASRSPREW